MKYTIKGTCGAFAIKDGLPYCNDKGLYIEEKECNECIDDFLFDGDFLGTLHYVVEISFERKNKKEVI